MKRFLVLAIAAVLVLGMAATAFADVNITGEFRVRAANLNNINDLDSDTSDAVHGYDQRMRIWLTANVADDVTVKTRFTTSNGEWNGAKETGSNICSTTTTTYTDSAGDTVDVDDTSCKGISTDYAYLIIKKWNTSFSIGRQAASWGHKILTWGTPKDRAVITRKVGDMTLGFVLQKDIERSTTTAGDSDRDEYLLLAKGIGAGDHKIDILYVTVADHQTDLDGNVLDVSYDGKAGPVAIFAEYIDKSGDLLETATGDNPGFILAGVASKFGPVSAHVAYAAASNTFVADDDFTPTMAFGTSQVTAISNFGDTNDGAGDDTVSAIVLGAKMGMGEDMALGANFATGTLSDNSGSGADVTEIDLYMTYNLATKTSLTAGVAQVDIDGGGGTDPMLLSGLTIETKF